MLTAAYIVAVGAWIAWIYVQHRFGDRPTSLAWFAAMMGLGVFEYSKSAFSLAADLPAVPMAIGSALLAAGIILVLRARRAWREDLAPETTGRAYSTNTG